MKDPNDVRGTKAVRNILNKRGIDISRCDIRVFKGHCDIRGILSVVKGSQITDLQSELPELVKLIRRKPEIRDVNLEVTIR
ncbi:MAG: hypothetical protein QOJ65_2502 [Fimbriimonadaceae bacterium]|jgi:hypothetical protein|nr:hypothetical protein [Fimbriimonadaceae bacterium]